MGNLYKYTMCKFIQSVCHHNPCLIRRKVDRLGVSWRDGLTCGKRVCFGNPPFRIVGYSGKNGQKGYSGNLVPLAIVQPG
jgi:hypothetical protein